jgi:hypothetical protein
VVNILAFQAAGELPRPGQSPTSMIMRLLGVNLCKEIVHLILPK